MTTRQELERAFEEGCQRISKIKERISDLDEQIKNTSINHIEAMESELAELRNSYYEVQAGELIGDFDAKRKRDIEEKIQAGERKLKTDSDRLQNLVGIRHALEAGLKNSQALMPQYQAALERFEFEGLKQERRKLAEEISNYRKELEALFGKVTAYNLNSIELATRIISREYQLKGFSNGPNLHGNGKERVHQLAQPFDLNDIKSSLAETLSEIISKSLTC